MGILSARYRIHAALAALLLGAGTLCAQAPGTCAIMGTVHDPAGLVVANAAVSASNESTGTARSATSNSAGVFTFMLLSPGTYTVAVSAPGFEANTQRDV